MGATLHCAFSFLRLVILCVRLLKFLIKEQDAPFWKQKRLAIGLCRWRLLLVRPLPVPVIIILINFRTRKLRTLRDERHEIDTTSFIIFYVNQNLVLPFLRLKFLNFALRILETPLCSVSADHAKFVLWLHIHQLQICSVATLMCLEHA